MGGMVKDSVHLESGSNSLPAEHDDRLARAERLLGAAITLLHILVTEQQVMKETYQKYYNGERSPSWPHDRFNSNVDYVIEKTQELFPLLNSLPAEQLGQP